MREKYASKLPARNAVNNAIRSGILTRLPCEECGDVKSQAHHPNGYDQPHWLDVQWLCVRHHKAAHGALRPEPF